MKYSKVIIFFMFMLGAAAFFSGAKARSEKFQPAITAKQAAYGERENKESEKIAVVNLDEGVYGKSGQINYAEKLSRFPSTDFEYSSLEAARAGLETGKYGAYVIIPADFSQNVESVNAAPQTSQLEYAVNQSYSGEGQYELLYSVLSYIDSLNSRLSYMYVDNILKEFHEAQDGADSVMENDLRDKAAIERIKPQDLATLAEIPKLQMEENTIEALDISGYAAKDTALAMDVKEEYAKSIQDIQAETASLSADSAALSERLNSLGAQVMELDFTLDENGESIVEKADSRLRAELEEQSGRVLEKESVIQYLRKLQENNEEFIKSWEQLLQSEDRTEQLISLLERENQEIESFLKEVMETEDIDIDRISELVKKEYAEPLESKADEMKKAFQQRWGEETAAVSSYSRQLADFQPQIDDQLIELNINEMLGSHARMQNSLSENNRAYEEYAQKSAASASEYADELHRYMTEIKKKSDEAAAEGLSEAQKIKEETSSANQRILSGFASKLSYTRIGRAEYTQVYQFIVNPAEAEDRSGNQESEKIQVHLGDAVKNRAADGSLDQAASEITAKKEFLRLAAYAVPGILFAVLLAQIYIFIRRRKDYEYQDEHRGRHCTRP